MVFTRVGAVLLSSILLAGCNSSQASSSGSYLQEMTFRIKDASLVSSDGSVLIELVDDDSIQSFYRGKKFWVHMSRISTGIRTDQDGTYIIVSGTRGAGGVNLSQIYKAMIVVRTGKLKDAWDSFLEEQKEKIYGPKDVFPPESNPETR